jgi:hypothetical protein
MFSGSRLSLRVYEKSKRDTSTLRAATTSGPPNRRHSGSAGDIDHAARCPSAEPSVHNPLPTSAKIPSRRDASLSRSAGRARRRPRVDAVLAGVVGAAGPMTCRSVIAPLLAWINFLISRSVENGHALCRVVRLSSWGLSRDVCVVISTAPHRAPLLDYSPFTRTGARRRAHLRCGRDGSRLARRAAVTRILSGLRRRGSRGYLVGSGDADRADI